MKGLLLITSTLALLLTGCGGATTPTPAPATTVVVTVTVTPSASVTPSIIPSSTSSSNTTVSQKCDETKKGLPIGSCIVDKHVMGEQLDTQAAALKVCHDARYYWIRQAYGIGLPGNYKWFFNACGVSISMDKHNQIDIKGLPDATDLPSDWPSDKAVNPWYQGQILIRGSGADGNVFTQVYDRNGNLLSPNEADATEALINQYFSV